MTRLANLVARTVARVGPSSVSAALTFGAQTVYARGTAATIEDEKTILAGEGLTMERIVRIPVTDIPSDPAVNMAITVDGEPFKIQACHRRGPVWLIGLERVQVRP